MKKIIQKLIACVLAISLLLSSTAFALADSEEKPFAIIFVPVDSTDKVISSVNSGDTFFINVNFVNNDIEDSVTAYDLQIGYDSSKIEVLSKGNGLSSPEFNPTFATGVMSLGWSNGDGLQASEGKETATAESGMLFYIKCKALGNLSSQDLNNFKILDSASGLVGGKETVQISQIKTSSDVKLPIIQAPAIEVAYNFGSLYSSATAEQVKDAISKITYIDASGTSSNITSADTEEWNKVTVGTPSVSTENNITTLSATVTYNGCETTISGEVTLRDLVSLSITTNPTTTSFTSGDTLDLSGMVVKGVYNDSDTAVTTTDYTVEFDGNNVTSMPTLKVADNEKKIKIYALNNDDAKVYAKDSSANVQEITIAVTPKAITVPTIKGSYTYSALEQTVAVNNFDDSTMYLQNASTSKATNAGTYNLYYALKDTTETVWASGGTDDKTVTWTISPKAVATPTIVVAPDSYTYTGSAITPTSVVVKDGETTIDSSEYKLDYSSNISVGTATVTVTDNKSTGNYEITEKSETFTINKAKFTDNDAAATTATFLTKKAQGGASSDQSVEIDLSKLINTVVTTDIVTYEVATSLPTGITATESEGKLTVKLAAGNNDSANDSYGTFTVTAKNSNYEDTTITVTVAIQDITFTVDNVEAAFENVFASQDDAPEYGMKWSDILGTKATIKAVVGTTSYTDGTYSITVDNAAYSADTYPGAKDSYAIKVLYNGTLNNITYTNVEVVSGTIKVAKKSLTPTISGVTSKNYDGNTAVNSEAKISLSGAVLNEEPTASATSIVWTSANAETTTVSASEISLETTPTDWTANYELTDTSITGQTAGNNVKINKASAPTFTAPTANASLTAYSSNAQDLIALATNVTGGTVKYCVGETAAADNSSDWITTSPQGTAAGSYKVWYKLFGDGNHNDSTAASITVTIQKASAPTFTAPTANASLTAYTGSAQDLISVVTDASGGTVKYCVGETAAADNSSDWITTSPQGTAAGSYKVWYKLFGDGNHNDSTAASITVTIQKATYSGSITASGLTLLSSQIAQGNQTASYVISNITFNPSIGTITGIAKDASSSSYIVDVTKNNDGTLTVGYTPQASSTTGGKLVLTISSDNYNDVTATIDITFVDKTNVDGKISIDGLADNANVTYGTAIQPTLKYDSKTTDANLWTVTYSGTDKSGATDSAYAASTAPKNVGEYTLTVKYEDDIKENNIPGHIGTKTVNFKIVPKVAEFTWSASTFKYDGNDKTVTATVNNKAYSDADSSFTLTYENNVKSAVNTNPGYTASVIALGNNNYTLEGSTTASHNWTITKGDQAALTLTGYAGPYTYGDAAFTVIPEGGSGTGSYTVTSSNTNVLTVSGTTVTIVGAGTATLKLDRAGDSNYSAATQLVTGTITVNPKSISDVTIASVEAKTYTGSAITPTPAVTDGGTTLASGTDFTYSYSNNTNAGTATITVRGKGNYTDTKSTTFTINKAVTTDFTVTTDSSYPYTTTYSQLPTTATVGNESVAITWYVDSACTIPATGTDALGTQAGELTVYCKVTGTPQNYTLSEAAAGAKEVTLTLVAPSTPSAPKTVVVSKIKNGTVTVNKPSASKGATVTLTAKPNKGYELYEIYVLDKNGDEVELKDLGDGKYSFVMPSGKVTVYAEFAIPAIGENPFSDVSEKDFFYDAVLWAYTNNITSGTSKTLFSPNVICTRAQTVTFLWRAAGSPEPVGTSSGFKDVKAGSYYEKAVIWAVENGITAGTSATTFGPDEIVTRAQTVTFLWRAEGKSLADYTSTFKDVPTSQYYAPAVDWAVEEEITSGTSKNTFSPEDGCTRGQIVTFLFRAFKNK